MPRPPYLREEAGRMNPVIDNIENRRSVRSYESTPIPKDVIEAIIDAGNWAPTGNNRQRWRFVVVEDSEFRQTLINAALPTWKRVLGSWIDTKDDYLREYFTEFFPKCLGWPRQSYGDTMRQARDLEDLMYWGAPVVIFVIGTASQECAMVCQNMMLAAQSLGLGSCIVGFGAQVTGDEEIVEALELKENERIYGPIVFGYPQIVPEPPKKREPVVKWI
jgi:nitroreductase